MSDQGEYIHDKGNLLKWALAVIGGFIGLNLMALNLQFQEHGKQLAALQATVDALRERVNSYEAARIKTARVDS